MGPWADVGTGAYFLAQLNLHAWASKISPQPELPSYSKCHAEEGPRRSICGGVLATQHQARRPHIPRLFAFAQGDMGNGGQSPLSGSFSRTAGLYRFIGIRPVSTRAISSPQRADTCWTAASE